MCVAASSCGREGARPAPPVAAVVLPDVSALEPAVQRQLRDRYASFTSKRDDPRTPPADLAMAYGDLGRLLMAATFNDEAALCYQHAEAVAPADMRWPYSLGHALLRKGERASAADAFARAARLAPTHVNTRVWLAEAYLDDGQLDSARETFAEALRLQPQSAGALFGAGRVALALRAYADAARYLELALAADSSATAAHYPLAMAYRALGQTDKAEAELRQRGDAWPLLEDPLIGEDDDLLDSAIGYERRGMRALKSAEWASAAAAFRKGIELKPDDVSLRYWLGAALYASGDVSGADAQFQDVVRRSPSFAKAHFSLGAIHEAAGRRPAAIEEYSLAVRSDPDLAEARVRLAGALNANGQAQAAFVEYERAVQLDPAAIDAWIGGARSLIALHRKADAQQWLGRASRIYPERSELRELAARIAGM